jgi:aspartate-semialdehyde dehydrogenase
VFSNAKNFRRDPLCPLVVPLVNPSHLSLIPHQRSVLSLRKGFIITNANCATTGIVVPLKALEDSFGPLDTVIVTTLQAVSGAGYPGVSSMDIHDNIVPYISGEEEKIEWETLKILGGIDEQNHFDLKRSSPIKISATCTRVPVLDGHIASVSVKFSNQPPPSIEDIKSALSSYHCEAQSLSCHSAPRHVITVHEEEDRPQPRLDRYFQDGSGVNVGRIRPCPVLDFKFICLVNNVAIGAATSSVMNVSKDRCFNFKSPYSTIDIFYFCFRRK